MFNKLNIAHNFSEQSESIVVHQFGKIVNDKWLGIKYYKANIEVEQKILSLIDNKYRHLFTVNYMVINSQYVPPHTDDKISTTVNFYVNTADAVTTFYRKKEDIEIVSEKLPEQSHGRLYDVDDLYMVSKFIAKPNEVYLLDVQQLHSVSCNKQENRTAYCLQSYIGISYDKCLEILNAGLV